MKRNRFITVLIFCFVLSVTAVFSAEKTITFDKWRTLVYNPDTWCTVNGNYVDFNSNGVPFFTYTENLPEGSVNYLPIRTVAEAIGLIIGYNAESDTVELRSADRILLMTTNSPYASLYDTSYNLIKNLTLTASSASDTVCPVRNIEGTTYIPIRAVTESFGFFVDYSNGQIIIATSQNQMYTCEKDSVSRVINVYGLGEVRISNSTNAAGLAKFKENNKLADLTGYLCRTREGMWITGIPESILEYYTDVIPPKYFDCVYYKAAQNAPWTKFTDDVVIPSVYDISTSMTTVSLNDEETFFFSDLSELTDTDYYDVFNCLYKSRGFAVKAVIDTYTADYNAITTGQSEKSTLYRIYLPYDEEYCYILKTGNSCQELQSELFDGLSFTEDMFITVPDKGNVHIYCDIIIVDILDA